MKTLPSPQYQLALRTMNYMARSKLLLKPEELQDALSVETDSFISNPGRRPPIAMILAVCLGFVIENPISGKMEFFHITLAEFLSTPGLWNDLKLDFGGCCVTYLLSEDFMQRCSSHEVEERRRQHPFAAYASRFWGDNIRGESELKYKDVLLQFLTSDNRISCFQLLPPDTAYDAQLIGEPSEWFDTATDSHSFAIYTCAYLRLKNTMPLLLAKGFGPDYTAPFGQRFSALHLAVKARDPEICEWLIQAGADVNVRDKAGQTPLHHCWEHSDTEAFDISRLLENAGARFDIPDSKGQTVLHHALQCSSLSWVSAMIEKSYEFGLEKQDLDGNTALHYAVMRRYANIVDFLLIKNANPVLKNNNGQSPLNLAMESDDYLSEKIVKQILARIDKKASEYELQPDEQAVTAAYLAACTQPKVSKKPPAAERTKSHLGLENLQSISLVAEQEDPYTLSGYLLKERTINFIDKASGMTPLHHAVLAGHELPAWHLLAAGADADVKDERHGLTPLELAQREGHQSVAALFRCDSEASGSGFVWQRKSYQVGRGMWSKRISGAELQQAYSNANRLRARMMSCSFWSGPGMEIWYDYLGYDWRDNGRYNLL